MKCSDFLYPRSCYHGQQSTANLAFNANLQKFAQRVTYICNLTTNGKLSPDEAYSEIKSLWKQLKLSKKQLGIGSSPSRNDDEDNRGGG
ncbi:MAG: hypothetical protein AB4426_31825 [Xenococcaceae cyanobacterium]